MIDGTIARKTNSVGKFGSEADTAADIVFVTAAFIKLLPKFNIPLWLWVWVGIIAIIKIGNIVLGYISKRRFISLHTVMNKITGLLLFLLPLTTSLIELKYNCAAVCIIATISAIQETFYVIKSA